MSKTQSRLGITITDLGTNNYGAFNRDNAGGSVAITDVSQVIDFGASYPIGTTGGTPIYIDFFNNEITALEGGHYAIFFSTQLLGTGDRVVVFHLNIDGTPFDLKKIKKELNTPNHFSMVEVRPLSVNQTITVSAYYETSVGSDNNITLDHPTLLVTKLS